MTSRILIRLPTEPVQVKPSFFPMEARADLPCALYHECKAATDGVYFLCFGGQRAGTAISELELFGLVHGLEEEDEFGMHSLAYEALQNVIRESKEPWRCVSRDPIGSIDQWFIIAETHDMYMREIFAFLLLDLYSKIDKERCTVIGANFADETSDVKQWGQKIQNLIDQTNPLINPKAAILFELPPRDQHRIIAYESMTFSLGKK